MPTITPMTELDAVNELLMSIGQSPVNTLNVTGIKDVSLAKLRLSAVTRRVLTRGWNFNTDTDYPLTPDADGHILIPSGALRVDPSSKGDDFTFRRNADKGLCLYDKGERTFVFTEAVDCTVVWGFAFEDLPETARCYIATAAGRRFQATVIGSAILDRFEEEDVASAWFLLERDERASRDTNLFRSNTRLSSLLSRRY
jgi:hypothetical protein